MKENKPFSLKDRAKSVSYAWEGLVTFFRTQHNAWIHVAAAAGVILLGFWLDVTEGEWCWIVMAITLVFISELFNTALEFLTDLASPDLHPLAKKVKDVAAAAVLIAAIGAIAIGVLVFLPYFF